MEEKNCDRVSEAQTSGLEMFYRIKGKHRMHLQDEDGWRNQLQIVSPVKLVICYFFKTAAQIPCDGTLQPSYTCQLTPGLHIGPCSGSNKQGRPTWHRFRDRWLMTTGFRSK